MITSVSFGILLLCLIIAPSISEDVEEGEYEFVPLPTRPSNSRTCCSKPPYNVTTQATYIRSTPVSFTATRTGAVGARLNCPGPFWPNRHTVEDCQIYGTQYYIDYREVTKIVTRFLTQEKFCMPDDIICCDGYTRFLGSCYTPEEVAFYNSLGIYDN